MNNKKNIAAKESLVLNLPNVISALRVAMFPLLLWMAVKRDADTFLSILAFSFFTDVLDGYLARKLNQVTEFGSQLDSWADFATYGAMLVGLFFIWPTIYQSESLFLMLALSFWLFASLVCLARFRCFPNYHTYAAKLVAIGSAPAYFVAAWLNEPMYIRMALLAYLWVAIEQVLITSVLPRWQGNIAGIWHALALARRASSDNHGESR